MKKFYSLFIIASLVLASCGSDDSPVLMADTQSPTAPINLLALNITENSALLSWEASTDNIGVTAYQLYENGTLTETNITSTNFTISSLIVDTAYDFYVTAIDASGNESNASNTTTFSTPPTPLTYESNLSEMGVFTGTMSNLTPASGVQLYELNSTLFTDYASKQRLVRLPNGQKMVYDNSNLLPKFPDNTLIAKTFYYNLDDGNPGLGKQIIETRIQLKISGSWQVGNYIWNESQTDAVYSEVGSEIPVSYINTGGTTQNINYIIPAKQDCFTCHNNNNINSPIGMKLRNMNFTPSYISQNQLDYFTSIGLLEGVVSSNISVLPDWTDSNLDILDRGRAYIDINCAHCHQPGGPVTNFTLDFRLETPFLDTSIYEKRGQIEDRIQSTLPTYRMPQLGRTIVHTEGVTMLLEYLQAIED
jgi:uncharacterized repeat protein (TIGR03806 family)